MADAGNTVVTVSDAEPVDSCNLQEIKCRICYGLLLNPYQSTCCGQHFCHKCISKSRTTVSYCPWCRRTAFECFNDISFGRRVKETKVYCVNKQPGCSWQGRLGDLQQHLSVDTPEGECKHQLIVCSNVGCNDEVRRSAMKLHLAQCQYRSVTCVDCGIVMRNLDMQNTHNPCPKKLSQCPNNGCKAKIAHLDYFKHLKACEFCVVNCPIVGCDVHLLKKDLKSHMEAFIVSHQLTMNSRMKTLEEKHIVELEHARESLIKKLEGKMAMLNKDLSGKLEKLQNKMEKINAEQLRLSHCVDDTKKMEHFVSGLMEIAAKVRVENWRLYLHTIAEFSTQLSSTQPVIVSLQNYSTKLEQSSKPGGLSFRTAQFYSSRGYRMYLNINPSSQGVHKGKYLAVFINITEGNRDDQLSWPYDGRVRIKLLNQLYDRDHYSGEEYYLSRHNPSVKYHCIMQPASGSNQGWGYSNFISSEKLKKSESTPHVQYLVNDSLFFEVNAD